MRFEAGNTFGRGGKQNPAGGRPKREEQAAKAEMRAAALEALCGGTVSAVNKLLQHLSSKKENISIRAAESVIEFALKVYETEELEKRIAALEEKLSEAK